MIIINISVMIIIECLGPQTISKVNTRPNLYDLVLSIVKI